MSDQAPDYASIAAAQKRIEGQAVITPMLSSPRVNAMLGGTLLIKAECLQRTGSFKFRGACNAVAMLDDDVRCVVAWSSGNHAQAVSAAAATRGMRAIIVMPEDAPAAKIDGTKALGGEVVTYDRYNESREDIGTRIAAENNAAIIPPFDYAPVIAGQGTIGAEVGEECKQRGITPHQLVCCTGGGGLLAGVSIGFHHHFPEAEIFAAEPENFDDFRRSLESGEICRVAPDARSICDAILTPQPGEMTFPINQQHCSKGVVFSDDDALDAMAFAWAHFKIVVEPGGAAALAAVLNGAIDVKDKTTVVIVSGGNVDRQMFERALSRLAA